MNSLLRFDNNQIGFNIENKFEFLTNFCLRERVENCLEIEIDQRV